MVAGGEEGEEDSYRIIVGGKRWEDGSVGKRTCCSSRRIQVQIPNTTWFLKNGHLNNPSSVKYRDKEDFRGLLATSIASGSVTDLTSLK